MCDQVLHLEAGFPLATWTGAPYPHYGSRDLVSRLRYNQNAEAGSLGLSYRVLALPGRTE
jgi:hypothetical protein